MYLTKNKDKGIMVRVWKGKITATVKTVIMEGLRVTSEEISKFKIQS